ncbi:uncharacterized protein PAC_18684 [Phialocephala subalpina]|uniref:BZIP domain-containing protein n=1 Tax=Phialocephala subalpina TaxID=576137 RepID=A0A1L7XUU5_9HELO|nr:uncharacterized protein PAC_18684 [Phialocephala subalpina]
MTSSPAPKSCSAETAAERRIRKREQDRRCQRASRERTKARMAQLEQLVEDLRGRNSSGQVTDLLNRLDAVSKERDSLAKILKSIRVTLRAQEMPLSGAEQNDEIQRREFPEEHEAISTDDQSFEPISPSRTMALESGQCYLEDSSLNNFNFDLAEEICLPDVPSSDQLGCDDRFKFQQEDHQDAIIIPRVETGCECCPGIHKDQRQILNFWRFANETLTRPVACSAAVNRVEEAMTNDTPIRALLEGWDAVAERAGGNLPPSWAKLRRIDETLFIRCAPVERLAIMRTMHKMFRHDTVPSLEKQESLPSWYSKRPSQAIAHSYAIDYFAWPGIRERFVFHQHRYCSNIFWDLFCDSLRILWPFEFRDCYTRNTETSQYNVSQAFEERITDINAWAMGPGMFEKWPEFYSDIPTFIAIPGKVSTLVAGGGLIEAPRPKPVPTPAAIEEDEQGFEANNSAYQILDPWSISWMLSS